MTSWLLLQSSGATLDSQIIGAISAALLTGLIGWNAWITVHLIKVMVAAEVDRSRYGPVLDAIYKDLPSIALRTNPHPYTEREKLLMRRFEDDPDQMGDDELEELRQALDAKRRDETEYASFRTTAALMQGAVRGELEARKAKGRLGWFQRWIWDFRP